MGKRDGYAHGTFCWVELSTTDQEAAKEFYASLFGWRSEDRPAGENEYYSMQSLGDDHVAAISGQPKAQREAGVPPLWNSYVYVEDADAVVAKIEALGGKAHTPAFDVFTAGRMAVLQDPQGAFFMVWQPGDHRGAGLVNEPGALVWNELATSDLAGASEFYSSLFGWTVEPFENSPMEYLAIKNGTANNGGITPLQGPMPPHWLVYFGVSDVEQALARVDELGGSKLVGPIDIGIAKIAVVQDPQGAIFALYAGQLEP